MTDIYEDCSKCGERFWGEEGIKNYLRQIDKKVLFKGSLAWECSSVCISCIEETDSEEESEEESDSEETESEEESG